MESLGYFAARFACTIEYELDKAVLHIDITQEGPQAVLAGVEMEGLKANRPDDVQKFLGLETGKPIGWSGLREAQHRLYRSGRFTKHLITARVSDDKSKVTLKLEMKEVAGAPPVSEALSPVEQAALKWREWLLTRWSAGEELVVEAREQQNGWLFAVGPDGGVIRYHGNIPNHPTTAPATQGVSAPTLDMGLALTLHSVQIFDFGGGKKMLAVSKEPLSIYINGTLHFLVKPDGDVSKNFTFNAGMDTFDHLQLGLKLSPSYFVDLMHDSEHPFVLRDGVLTCTVGGNRVRVEAATGRMLECTFAMGESSIDIRAGRGQVAGQIDTMERALPGPNSYDPKKPAGSAISFIASTISRLMIENYTVAGNQASRQILAKILTSALADPIEKMVGHLEILDSSDFVIPAEPGSTGRDDLLRFIVLRWGLPLPDSLFDRGSWPWVLTRQALLSYVNARGTFVSELNLAMHSNRIGPVGMLMSAKLIQPVNREAASSVAAQGLKQLDLTEFRKDITVLTQGDSAAAQFIRSLARELQNLSPGQVKDLTEALQPRPAHVLGRLIATLQAHRGEPIEKAVSAALEDAWQDSLQGIVREALLEMVPKA